MANYNIATAVKILEELHAGLDTAYWEASSIERKDFFYDLISAVHSELFEIGKLSVQDLDLSYEPISANFRDARQKLNTLKSSLDELVLRNSTRKRLAASIVEALAFPPL